MAGFWQSVFLVSEGVTLTSQLNTEVNIIGYEYSSKNSEVSVPLPETLGLFGLAMAGLSFRRKFL